MIHQRKITGLFKTTTNKGISVTQILDAMSKRISTNLNHRNNADQNHQT